VRPTTIFRAPGPTKRSRSRGQALVEFSLVLIPFLLLLMGIVDLGRGIYTNNAVAEAAREIARVTSVHPCTGTPCTLGNGAETLAVVNTQRTMVPGFDATAATLAIQCVDLADANRDNDDCRPGQFARVTVTVPFQVLTPLLGSLGPFTLSSTSHIELP
jgi:Flp pilus assembly protein TadG